MEEPYSKRELDDKFRNLYAGLDLLNVTIKEGFAGVHARQDKTNGKVNKLVLSVVAIVCAIVGYGFNLLAPFLSLLL